jgi:hypothetical protein
MVLHQGFVGGKLAGAKALNMQRWLWTHDCDIAVMGHSHNIGTQKETVESLNDADQVVTRTRRGCFAGSYLKTNIEDSTTYSEVKGYMPAPLCTGEMMRIRPGASDPRERIRIIS